MDYEQLYYDALYQKKKLNIEIESLKTEIEILKGNKKLIEFIIAETKKHYKREEKAEDEE